LQRAKAGEAIQTSSFRDGALVLLSQ